MKFLVFRDDRHEAFYYRMLAERRCTDIYHRALFYTLGLSKDTRAHIQELFDFSDGGIKPEGLSASWQTLAIPFSHRRRTPYLNLPKSGILKTADLLLGKDGG